VDFELFVVTNPFDGGASLAGAAEAGCFSCLSFCWIGFVVPFVRPTKLKVRPPTNRHVTVATTTSIAVGSSSKDGVVAMDVLTESTSDVVEGGRSK